MKYVIYKGIEEIVLDSDVDAVAVILDNGSRFELKGLRDGEAVLKTMNQLIIEPQCANVVRVREGRF